MNSELIEEWEKIVGPNKIKIISNKYFDSRLDLEFPEFREGNYEYKNFGVLSELENNANILNEFERNGFLTHDEVSRMIEVATQNIINKSMNSAFFENLSMIIDYEILNNIRIKLIDIAGRGLITNDEVTLIIKVLDRNVISKNMHDVLFKYVCILLDEEKFKDQGEDERLEMVIRYIREELEIIEEKEEMLE